MPTGFCIKVETKTITKAGVCRRYQWEIHVLYSTCTCAYVRGMDKKQYVIVGTKFVSHHHHNRGQFFGFIACKRTTIMIRPTSWLEKTNKKDAEALKNVYRNNIIIFSVVGCRVRMFIGFSSSAAAAGNELCGLSAFSARPKSWIISKERWKKIDGSSFFLPRSKKNNLKNSKFLRIGQQAAKFTDCGEV